MEQKTIKIVFAFIIFFFVLFVFYDLNWGAPFYFHPDERNIASSVSQLKFPENLNPNFYAYGALPIYLVYFINVFINYFNNQTLDFNVTFEQAIIVGRFLSGLLTLLTVYLLYKFTFEFFGRKQALLATFFALTSVAYLQYSHFGTFEIWLSAGTLFFAYTLDKFLKSDKIIFFIIASSVFGILCALKASSLFLIILPLFVILVRALKEKKHIDKIKTKLKLLVIFIFFSASFYIISSPFNIVNNQSFLSTLTYEKKVATGEIPVFYTGSFNDTLPIIFQYTNVFPFLINPLITLMSIPAIIFLTFIFIKKKNIFLGLILFAFFSLFISQSVLFVKWTRYIVPSISFLYILISIFFFEATKRINKTIVNFLLVIIIGTSLVFAFSFIKTVRLSEDSRVQSRDFLSSRSSYNSQITSEIYDLGIVPFNNNFGNIKLFDFYGLDNGGADESELSEQLKTAEYIILPSPRLYRSRTLNSDKFPKGSKFYGDLFSGQSGFQKIYETPCDIFCKITYMGNPVFNVEETANVFDRPNVFIFKRKN